MTDDTAKWRIVLVNATDPTKIDLVLDHITPGFEFVDKMDEWCAKLPGRLIALESRSERTEGEFWYRLFTKTVR